MVARAPPLGRHTGARMAEKGQLPSYGSTCSLGGTGPGPDLSTGPDQDMTMSWPCLVRVLAVSQSCPGRVRVASRTGGLRPHSVHSTQVRSTVRVRKASTSPQESKHMVGGGTTLGLW